MSQRSPHLSLRLMELIGSPFCPRAEAPEGEAESSELCLLAAKNKMLLPYLQALEEQGRLSELGPKYEAEKERHSRFLGAVSRLSTALTGAPHAVFKTIRRYPAVPSDIDVIVLGNNDAYLEAIKALLKEGYTPLLPGIIDLAALAGPEALDKGADKLARPTYGRHHISPGGTHFVDSETGLCVDLQREISVSHVVYVDKTKFTGHLRRSRLPNGVEISVLSRELELAIIVAHSVAERHYRLGEFYTFVYHLLEMGEEDIRSFINVVGEHRLRNATAAFGSVTAQLHEAAYGRTPQKLALLTQKLGVSSSEAERLVRSSYAMPHGYGARTLLQVFWEKMGEDRFRTSALTQAVRTLDPRLLKLTIDELRGRRE